MLYLGLHRAANRNKEGKGEGRILCCTGEIDAGRVGRVGNNKMK